MFTIVIKYDNIYFSYETQKRITGLGETRNATLSCNGSIDVSYIGILTADEIAFAGGYAFNGNINYYLVKEASSNIWWSLSPADYFGMSEVFSVYKTGLLSGVHTSIDALIRPAITLKTGTTISGGDGTQEHPYVIN